MQGDVQHGKLRGHICNSRETLQGKICDSGPLRGAVHMPTITAEDIYTGETEVTPTIEGQTLPTQFKTLVANISVQPIPFAAVSNDFGGTTITIGGF